MDIDPVLVNLVVSYAANVGADATRWVSGKFKRSSTVSSDKTAGELNLSVQSQLTTNGVDATDAEKVAGYLLETPILGYLSLLVQESSQSADYTDFPTEEVQALLQIEVGLTPAVARDAAEIIVSVLRAANKIANHRTRQTRPDSSRPLSGIQLFGAQESKRQFFSRVGHPSLSEISAYSDSARREARNRFNRMQLQHLDNGTEQQLSDLYVEPGLEELDPPSWSTKRFTPVDLMGATARAVILGPAGGGKSTTVRRLAAHVAMNTNLVPVVVELRKYSAQQGLAPQLFVDHMHDAISHLVQQAPPKNWLEYILVTGRAVVFFDGLDEVLNAGTRAEVRDAVRSFAQLFPATSIFVTSRFTGYDLAPLDQSEWLHAKVLELREDQVRDYAIRWFKMKNPESDFHARTSSFIRESREYAADLRANPLMLSLLCSVYYMRGDIPRTLHALYERCADMVYQQWNTIRGIEDHRAWDKDVRPVLYQVAHAVLNSDEYMSFGIPEEKLEREIRLAFIANGAPDPEEASRRARETVRLWSGRAWILTSVMSDAESRPRYGFVHQSFLEYFAAVYEVRRVDTPSELYTNLRARLINLNGWTVTQIAVSVVHDWKAQGSERFIDAVLEDIDSACDLDAYALWRFTISLANITPISAQQFERVAAGILSYVAESILLPTGTESTFASANEMHKRIRDYDRFEASNASDPAYLHRRETIRIPTTESEAVVADLAEIAISERAHAGVIRAVTLSALGSTDDRKVAAALLCIGILKKNNVWPDEGQSEASLHWGRRARTHWTLTWMAAQLGMLPVMDAVAEVPWHALLLSQQLVVSDEVDFSGPKLISRDLATCLDDTLSFQVLERLGATFTELITSSGIAPTVDPANVLSSFSFFEPHDSWRAVADPDLWSDHFLVAFAIIGKLATVAWGSGISLGELIENTNRGAIRDIAAAAAGWGGIDHLSEVDEQCRAAIARVLPRASSTYLSSILFAPHTDLFGADPRTHEES